MTERNPAVASRLRRNSMPPTPRLGLKRRGTRMHRSAPLTGFRAATDHEASGHMARVITSKPWAVEGLARGPAFPILRGRRHWPIATGSERVVKLSSQRPPGSCFCDAINSGQLRIHRLQQHRQGPFSPQSSVVRVLGPAVLRHELPIILATTGLVQTSAAAQEEPKTRAEIAPANIARADRPV